jgi:ketosteroid isomerase-like protein
MTRPVLWAMSDATDAGRLRDTGRAMSEESTTPDPVEISRRIVEADGYEEWAALVERYAASDAVWTLLGTGFGPFEGLAAIRAFIEEYWATWDDHHHYAEEIVDLGHGVVFWVVREEGRIKDSDAYVETTNAWVTQWVEGRLMRFTTYKDIDEARAAAERLAEERG